MMVHYIYPRGGGGGYSDIFIKNVGLVHFAGKNSNFIFFFGGGGQKNKCFFLGGGVKILEIFWGVITKLDYFWESFLCILGYFLKVTVQNGNTF